MTPGWVCPAPLRDTEHITMAHGGGGRLTSELVEHLFLPAFGHSDVDQLDAALLGQATGRLAFTTDAHVVQPLFFPGGSIGDLAVNGTVNDLAMVGAVPLALSVAFIMEEGLRLDALGAVAEAMGTAAERAGVPILTGDTKVVERGRGDGLSITTAGVGVVPDHVDIRPDRIRPGDAVIVSGPVGCHGVSVLSVREGLGFETVIRSDTAPLAATVAALVDEVDVHALRDPTRGGVAGTMYELASAADVGVVLDEAALPIPAEVVAACRFLGLDPLHVANEGVLVAVVDRDDADRTLSSLSDSGHPESAVVGEIVEHRPGLVVAVTALGSEHVVDRPLGEQLPRIC